MIHTTATAASTTSAPAPTIRPSATRRTLRDRQGVGGSGVGSPMGRLRSGPGDASGGAVGSAAFGIARGRRTVPATAGRVDHDVIVRAHPVLALGGQRATVRGRHAAGRARSAPEESL